PSSRPRPPRTWRSTLVRPRPIEERGIRQGGSRERARMASSVPRVPALRVQARNPRAARTAGDYVLYWMTANRRTGWNFALDRAVELAHDLEKPLLVLEPLRVGYRWNSDRIHRFVLDGMRANRDACAAAGVAY